MLLSNFAAVVEQPVSHSFFPVFCHSLGVLVPADLGLHSFSSLFSCRHLLKDILQEWNVQTSLPLVLCQSHHWCSAGVVTFALPCVWFHLLLQHLVLSPVAFQRESHTSLFSTSSISLCFRTETQILFQGMKCVQQGPGKFMAPEQPSPHQQGHRSCMKCICQSVMDFLINAFTSDRTCAFVIFVTV